MCWLSPQARVLEVRRQRRSPTVGDCRPPAFLEVRLTKSVESFVRYCPVLPVGLTHAVLPIQVPQPRPLLFAHRKPGGMNVIDGDGEFGLVGDRGDGGSVRQARTYDRGWVDTSLTQTVLRTPTSFRVHVESALPRIRMASGFGHPEAGCCRSRSRWVRTPNPSSRIQPAHCFPHNLQGLDRTGVASFVQCPAKWRSDCLITSGLISRSRSIEVVPMKSSRSLYTVALVMASIPLNTPAFDRTAFPWTAEPAQPIVRSPEVASLALWSGRTKRPVLSTFNRGRCGSSRAGLEFWGSTENYG